MPIERMLRMIWLWRLLEREVQRTARRAAGGVGEVRRQRASCRCPRCPTPGRCCRGKTLARRASRRAAECRCETRSSRRRVREAERRDRQHRDAVFVDQERVLVGAVRRAAVLHHPQPPRGHLVDRRGGRAGSRSPRRTPPAPGASAWPSPRSPVMTAVMPLVLQPVEQPPQLGPQDRLIRQPARTALSIVSSTTRLAPIESIACPRRTNRPSRSYSPLSSISLRSTWT